MNAQLLVESITSLAAARVVSALLSGSSLHQSWLSSACALLILFQVVMFVWREHIVPPLSGASLGVRLAMLSERSGHLCDFREI